MTEAALFHPRLPSTIICGTLDLFQRKPFGKDWHCSRSGTAHSISRNGHFYAINVYCIKKKMIVVPGKVESFIRRVHLGPKLLIFYL